MGGLLGNGSADDGDELVGTAHWPALESLGIFGNLMRFEAADVAALAAAAPAMSTLLLRGNSYLGGDSGGDDDDDYATLCIRLMPSLEWLDWEYITAARREAGGEPLA